MQIHELPSGVVTADDYVAIDNGSATRKSKLKDFDVANNTVAFTTRDESAPTEWKTFSTMDSGSTLSVLINRASAVASNVRYLKSWLGSTALGTTATTITGAIREIVNKIGSSSTGLTATTLTGMIRELRQGIGSMVSYTSSADISVPYSSGDTNVYVNAGSVTLSKGMWIVVCKARFSSNSTGVRRMNLADSAGANGWMVSYPGGDSVVDIQMTYMLDVNSETTYYLNLWQNSGTNLTCASGRVTIRAMKVGIR